MYVTLFSWHGHVFLVVSRGVEVRCWQQSWRLIRFFCMLFPQIKLLPAYDTQEMIRQSIFAYINVIPAFWLKDKRKRKKESQSRKKLRMERDMACVHIANYCWLDTARLVDVKSNGGCICVTATATDSSEEFTFSTACNFCIEVLRLV